MKKFLSFQLVISILIAQLAGVVGATFTISSIDIWYARLNKPSWFPPNEIFAPVWVTLYTLMGIAAYLIWQKKTPKKLIDAALKLYLLNLVFNSLWSIIFFGLNNLQLAFLEIVALWLTILLLVRYFYRLHRWAVYLLLPYLSWTTFAMGLNFVILLLN